MANGAPTTYGSMGIAGSGKRWGTTARLPVSRQRLNAAAGGYRIPNDYDIHTLEERFKSTKRVLQILRETLERRIYVDEAIESALANAECELALLGSTIKRLKETQ